MRAKTVLWMLGLAMVATLFAGNRGCVPIEPEPGVCEYEGEFYEIGESFPAADGCNTCACTEEGDVACTAMACPEGCEYGGDFYEVGERFPAGDGCNTCVCLADGGVACTEIACEPGCEYAGVFYPVGESFPAGDGCNTCFCQERGQVVCTEIACEPGCEYGGAFYRVGESFPAGDGCNTCFCDEGGQVACTEIACAPAILLGGGSSFGECMGPCRRDLRFDGEVASVVVSGWDGEVFADNRGALTDEGRRRARAIGEALLGVELEPVYGCPDCADGGAAYVLLARHGRESRHTYEFAHPPAELADADAFVSEVLEALARCEPTAFVLPDADCRDYQPF